MRKTIIVILFLSFVISLIYFGYTTFSKFSTPSKKEERVTETQVKTDFEPEIKILETLKDFTPNGDFPITLDTNQFGRDNPFANY